MSLTFPIRSYALARILQQTIDGTSREERALAAKELLKAMGATASEVHQVSQLVDLPKAWWPTQGMP